MKRLDGYLCALAATWASLKVAGVLTLPWAWVLSPLWLPPLVYVAIVLPWFAWVLAKGKNEH